MAKANPVNKAPEGTDEGPAPAADILMAPVKSDVDKLKEKADKAAKVAAAAVATPEKDVVSLRDEALAGGKAAQLISPRAVRVDN